MICLQECWISNLTDLSNIQLPGYDCITQGKSSSKNGGLVIYVDNRFQYEVQLNIQLPGYDYIAQGKSSSKNGGLIIYVDNRFRYEVQLNINTYEYWEGLTIKGWFIKSN